MRKSRKTRVGVDHSLCRLRNLVDRCFKKLNNARRVAIRYDKTATSFLGLVNITSIACGSDICQHDLARARLAAQYHCRRLIDHGTCLRSARPGLSRSL